MASTPTNQTPPAADGPAVAAGARFPQQRKSRGQSLAEFALTVPFALLMVLFGLDFGRVFLGWVSLNQATREAANYAAMNPTAWTLPYNAVVALLGTDRTLVEHGDGVDELSLDGTGAILDVIGGDVRKVAVDIDRVRPPKVCDGRSLSSGRHRPADHLSWSLARFRVLYETAYRNIGFSGPALASSFPNRLRGLPAVSVPQPLARPVHPLVRLPAPSESLEPLPARR